MIVAVGAMKQPLPMTGVLPLTEMIFAIRGLRFTHHVARVNHTLAAETENELGVEQSLTL